MFIEQKMSIAYAFILDISYLYHLWLEIIISKASLIIHHCKQINIDDNNANTLLYRESEPWNTYWTFHYV